MADASESGRLAGALAQVVGGVYVLTLKDRQDGPQALVASFVQQVAFEPPRIVVSVSKKRQIVPALDRTRGFVLNVCAEGDPKFVLDFVEGAQRAGQALNGRRSRPVGPGFVLDSAAGHLVCSVLDRVDIGDHWLYIASVVDGAAAGDRRPLVHIRRSGLRY